MDPRETFLRNLNNIFIQSGIDAHSIQNQIITELGKWEITERSTAISVIENESDQIIRMFFGALLTEGKSKRTVKAYNSIYRKYERETGVMLHESTTFSLRLWLAQVQQKTSLTNASNCRNALSSFFNWAYSEGIMQENPMDKIKPIKCPKPDKDPFSEIEIDKIRCSCTSLRDRAIFELMLSSGARVSEVAGLDVSDINFYTKELSIHHGKGNKSRKTYINDITLEHIKKYLLNRQDENTSLFVSGRNERLSSRTIETILHNLGNAAGVENTHPHRCRRTFASNLAKKGMDIRTIQILMGHSNINTTMIYVKFSDGYVENEYRKYA